MTFHLCLLQCHFLEEIQLDNLMNGVAVAHFSMGAQKNLKTKNLIFSPKMQGGCVLLAEIKNLMTKN